MHTCINAVFINIIKNALQYYSITCVHISTVLQKPVCNKALLLQYFFFNYFYYKHIKPTYPLGHNHLYQFRHVVAFKIQVSLPVFLEVKAQDLKIQYLIKTVRTFSVKTKNTFCLEQTSNDLNYLLNFIFCGKAIANVK